jgi:hypothetical protein
LSSIHRRGSNGYRSARYGRAAGWFATTDVPPGNLTEPNNAGVTLSPSGTTIPSSAESVERVAEERAQQTDAESKDRLQENSTGWALQAFLIAVMATAVLLGLVIYLFRKRRNIGQRTAETNLIPDKNSEGGEKARLETTPGEVLPDIVLSEPSKLSTTDSSAVGNVAELAKLYAMGTPSEKEFQRLKGLIFHSIADSQEPELR